MSESEKYEVLEKIGTVADILIFDPPANSFQGMDPLVSSVK
jgi:hypothetical protein